MTRNRRDGYTDWFVFKRKFKKNTAYRCVKCGYVISFVPFYCIGCKRESRHMRAFNVAA